MLYNITTITIVQYTRTRNEPNEVKTTGKQDQPTARISRIRSFTGLFAFLLRRAAEDLRQTRLELHQLGVLVVRIVVRLVVRLVVRRARALSFSLPRPDGRGTYVKLNLWAG